MLCLQSVQFVDVMYKLNKHVLCGDVCSPEACTVSEPNALERDFNNTSNVRIKVTLRRVRVIIFAVPKQYALHILSVCL
jgi:hypothetical protein